MADIHYNLGDATAPRIPGPKIICHCCNDLGKWGRGFVLALSKRWPSARTEYLAWFESKDRFELGEVRFVSAQQELWIANLIGQQGIYTRKGISPIRYDALQNGLASVAVFAKEKCASVHMPRMGCGLAGGEWSRVESILRQTLLNSGVETYVYDLNADNEYKR